MNRKVKKAIGIVIILLLVASVVVLYYKWNADRQIEENNNNNTIIDEDNNQAMDTVDVYEVTFKDFTYELPKTTTYSKVDENKFKLISDKYEAVIEPFVDRENYVLLYPERYYEVLLNKGLTVSKPEKMKIGIIDIVKYEKANDDDNSTLYYFTFYDSHIVYEIELYNLQDDIGKVINILLNANINEKAKYDYREMDFVKESNN